MGQHRVGGVRIGSDGVRIGSLGTYCCSPHLLPQRTRCLSLQPCSLIVVCVVVVNLYSRVRVFAYSCSPGQHPSVQYDMVL